MNEEGDDDNLAAEYVIGTLELAEKNAVEVRLPRDPAFAALVGAWAERLAPLLDLMPEVEPPRRVLEAVLAFIGGSRASAEDAPAAGQVIQLRRQVRMWRFATGVVTALAATLCLWVAKGSWTTAPTPTTYLAVLQQGGGGPAFLVSLDLTKREMTVVPSAAQADPDKSLQLWLIGAGNDDPQSLGLVDASAPVRASLASFRPDLISGATYAVTLEPKGGSPTGKPTSSPIYVGHLVEASR